MNLSLYLVTDRAQCEAAGRTVEQTVREAVAGGVTAVQLREKDAAARDFFDTVLRVAEELPARVELIVNDRVDVFLAARATGARVTGVHVGQSDLPADRVRAMVGPWTIVGVSASTPAELAAAARDGADYVGIGALHATRTKADAPPALGHEAFARLAGLSTLPAVAIGGITRDDLPALRAAGAAGAAVVSAICAASDPRAAARALAGSWEAAA